MASLKDVEKEAFQLSQRDRAILARNLIRSLENEEAEDETEALWIEEADRRYKELKSGRAKEIPASQVLDETRSRFQ